MKLKQSLVVSEKMYQWSAQKGVRWCREGGRGRDTGAPALRHSGSQLSRAALNSYY